MNINMIELVGTGEIGVRLVFFVGVFAIMALWEIFAPKRLLSVSKARRWRGNFGIVLLNTALLRVIFPAAGLGMALFAQANAWGVFNYLQVPHAISVLVSVLLLDLAIYLQHVMFHAVPTFWRVHRMHHTDLDLDVTTGIRFHPIEIILSMLIKFGVIAVLGAPAIAVLLFEILLNATSMFNHANVRMPKALDRLLRWLVVTPDMHRVHHSIEDDETNSNFGFNLPWWDRLFGTYREEPRNGHESMILGIRTFRDPKVCATFTGMLTIPFLGPVGGYAINRREWP
jgi:sterol desaturase/sphingolipid hydroxylase (fatty acid hydroxylase superfamily)